MFLLKAGSLKKGFGFFNYLPVKFPFYLTAIKNSDFQKKFYRSNRGIRNITNEIIGIVAEL